MLSKVWAWNHSRSNTGVQFQLWLMITALCCPLQYGFYYFQLVFSFMLYRFVSHLQTVCFCCVFVTFSAEGSLQERAGESRDGDQENHSHHSRVQTGSDPASSVNTFLQTRHVFGFFFIWSSSVFQICSQLSTRLEKQQAATKEELDIVRVRSRPVDLSDDPNFILFFFL